jgi:tetratricopeptide (TPR) repeat protein
MLTPIKPAAMFRGTRLILFLLVSTVTAAAQSTDVLEAINRGTGQFNLGRYELAMFEYRAALQWPSPEAARAHFNIGVCQYKLGRVREAISEYRRAIELREGRYPSASHALGIALRSRRQFADARAAFAQAVEASDGKHADALFELALESQRAGDDRAAFDQYRLSIAQSKDRIPANHNNLGVLLAKWGQVNDAMREFELALKQSRGRFVEAQENLALCRRLLDAESSRMLAQLKLSEERPDRPMRAE